MRIAPRDIDIGKGTFNLFMRGKGSSRSLGRFGKRLRKMPFLEIEFSDLEFHETLGRGSAGSVYRAVWLSKEKVVAVKKLNLLESEVCSLNRAHSP